MSERDAEHPREANLHISEEVTRKVVGHCFCPYCHRVNEFENPDGMGNFPNCQHCGEKFVTSKVNL